MIIEKKSLFMLQAHKVRNVDVVEAEVVAGPVVPQHAVQVVHAAGEVAVTQHNADLGLEASLLVQLDVHQPGVERDPSAPAIFVNCQRDELKLDFVAVMRCPQ